MGLTCADDKTTKTATSRARSSTIILLPGRVTLKRLNEFDNRRPRYPDECLQS